VKAQIWLGVLNLMLPRQGGARPPSLLSRRGLREVLSWGKSMILSIKTRHRLVTKPLS